MLKVFVAGVLASAGVCASALPGIEEDDVWGGRKEHPAVVNPVLDDESGNVVSLRGEWEFSTRGGNLQRNGLWGFFYREATWPGARTLNVPGCWEAQGVGEPGMGESWDNKGDHNAKPIRHKHMGNGWYRKTVGIPTAWKGSRIWLKVGGVKSRGWFWVNEQQVALVDNYCGTCKYEITDLVTPGSNATVVAQINNAVPSRKGLFSAMHRWGGIYRDIEIEATPQTFIDDAWVRGLFDEKAAEAHVTVAGGDGQPPSQIRFTVDGKTVNASVASNGETVVRLPLENLRPWSPEYPNLYTGIVELVENGCVIHTRRERFGVRKFEVRGKEFYLNGKPFYVRGFGDDHVYPITGITQPDRELHRAHLAKARAAGFNFVRLHTHAELPEYFEAADELGIMIQAELPYYSDMTAEGFAFDPKRDVTELWHNYRRHPSFAVYSMGNEGSFGPVLDRRLHDYIKAIDPDRLKINQDCHEARINPPDAADYLGGPIKPWPCGSVNPERPFVTHEYLNLCVKCDSRDEALYSGVWQPPATRKGRAEWLAKSGLGMEWGDRLQDAQHVLQRHYQKEGVESARRDPYCDGYIFWTIVDVVVEQSGAYTAQGLFNPFWEHKRGGFSAAEFAQFNSPSCVLLDTPDDRRVFTSGETLAADFLFAHYGDAALKGAALDWSLGAKQGRIPIGDIAIGPVRKVASEKIVLPDVEKSVKATLNVRVADVSNSWDFWVFPKRAKRDGSGIAVASSYRAQMEKRYDGLLTEVDAARAKVVVAEYGSQMAADALSRGQRVIMLTGLGGKPNVKLGWWWMGRQVGTAIADHPALAALPHEGCLTPLFFRLVLDTGKHLPYAGLEQDDMLIVGEGGDKCYLYLAQANIGRGSAVMGFGLDLLGDTPEATALMDGLIDYAASNEFAPKSRVEMTRLLPQNGWRRTVRSGERSVAQ